MLQILSKRTSPLKSECLENIARNPSEPTVGRMDGTLDDVTAAGWITEERAKWVRREASLAITDAEIPFDRQEQKGVLSKSPATLAA